MRSVTFPRHNCKAHLDVGVENSRYKKWEDKYRSQIKLIRDGEILTSTAFIAMPCHLHFSCSPSLFPTTKNFQTPLYISSDLSYKLKATEGPSDVQNILFLFALCKAEQIKCIQRDVGDIKWFLNCFITALLGTQALRCVTLQFKYSGWSKRGRVEQNHFFFSQR